MQCELMSFTKCSELSLLSDWSQLPVVRRSMACMVWHPEVVMKVNKCPYTYGELIVTTTMRWHSKIVPHVIHKGCHMSSRFEHFQSWNGLFRTSMCRKNGMPHVHMVMSTDDMDSNEPLDLNDRSTTFIQFQLCTKSKSLMLVEIKWSSTDVNRFSN